MTGFRFHSPLWLAALLVLIPLGLRFLRRRRGAVLYSRVDVARAIRPTLKTRLGRFIPWLRIMAVAALVIALARPQIGEEAYRVRAEGIAIQLCVDRSASMSAEDFELNEKPVSRLDAVKDVIRRFVSGDDELDLPGRKDDQIGLVAFGGFAEARCPATLDHGMLLKLLDDVDLPAPHRDREGEISPGDYEFYWEERGTAIGDALTLAVDQLKHARAKTRIIILLSDGQQTSGLVTPEQAIRVARSWGVRVYSVGVGSSGRHFLQSVDRYGKVQYHAQDVQLDEATLTSLANETNGAYFRANDTETLLRVYQDIDRLEKSATDEAVYRSWREAGPPWLLSGLLCLVGEVLLLSTRFRPVP